MTFLRNLTLFLAALLLIGSAAIGQTALPMCIPIVNGYPDGPPVLRQTTAFCHVYQLCNSKDGSVGQVEGISWPRAGQACDMLKAWPQAMQVHAASAKVTTAHELWRENVKFGCTERAILAEQSSRGRMCRERHVLLRDNKRAWWPHVTDWER